MVIGSMHKQGAKQGCKTPVCARRSEWQECEWEDAEEDHGSRSEELSKIRGGR